ncbi:MAG TPA: YggT family protein [Pseudomonadaceae bacterium]|nr:YggT family protein [Pseudomonadaceae bacterium]
MGGAFGQAVVLIINTLGAIYLLAVLLRFLLQAARADFYNPLTQAIVKLTSPLVNPLRRVIPGYRGIDFATLLLALLLNALASAAMITASGFSLVDIGTLVSWAFTGIVSFILNIYFWALVISVVASFIAPFSAHPALLLIHQLLDPLYKPLRRIIPGLGGLDFSPLFLFLGIRVLELMVINPLAARLGMSELVRSLVIGI